MKKLLLVLGCMVCTGTYAQTQQELNQQAHERYMAADKELHNLYQQIVFEYSEDKELVKKLQSAQQDWTRFRDNELRSKYPGSLQGLVQPEPVSLYLEQLTNERIKALQRWAEDWEINDVCGNTLNQKHG